MSRSDPCDPLIEALRDLPRETASDDFTSRVMERLEHERDTPSRPRLWIVALATVLGLAIGLPWLEDSRDQRRADDLAARTRELKERHRALELELEEIRTRYEHERPVVYLGGDDEVDFVLDLRPLAEELATRRPTPAALRSEM